MLVFTGTRFHQMPPLSHAWSNLTVVYCSSQGTRYTDEERRLQQRSETSGVQRWTTRWRKISSYRLDQGRSDARRRPELISIQPCA